MRKLVVISLFGVFLLLNPFTSLAAVNLPWSTTYNCADWTQSNGPYNINCNGLSRHGDWTCNNGDGTIREEQITAAANYPGGGGGKGQRHWIGDGVNNISGGMSASFPPPQKEIWMRWYMRYETGFRWNFLNNQKIIYFDPVSYTRLIIEYYGMDKIRVFASPVNGNYVSPNGRGWNTMMANGATDNNGNKISDGSWHLWEIHIKMDTNGTDGIVEVWIDGNQVINEKSANLGGGTLSYAGIGENAMKPNHSRCMYVDYDDIVISTTGPIGPYSGGTQPSQPKKQQPK